VEDRFAARCHAQRLVTSEPANPPEPPKLVAENVVQELLQGLPPDDRRLVEQLVLESTTQAELANQLGVSQATISRRKKKLLSALRTRLASICEDS
jgi:DNA-directed RNA polymerase specialized sigma24 family protein